MPKYTAHSLSLLLVFLSGCVMGPDYERPYTELPEAWPENGLLASSHTSDWTAWWTHYEDQTLDALIARALDDSLEIQLQADRIREARAQLGFSRAERFPMLNAQAEAIRQRQAGLTIPGAAMAQPAPSIVDQLIAIQDGLNRLGQTPAPAPTALEILRDATDQGPSGPGTGPTGNLLNVSAVLGYEVDLWGRVARQQEAAAALLDATVFSQDAIRLHVIADIVTVYFNLRAAEKQLAITEATIAAREEMLRIETVRYEGGRADALVVLQAESQLAAARSLVPRQEEHIALLKSALGLLVGFTPAELMAEWSMGPGTLDGLHLPEGVPADLPSEMLRRRPDIRAAEAALMAANAQIGIAQADRLPRLNLSAFLGTAAFELGDLFTAPAISGGMGASVFAPVLDFGRNRARVEVAQAQRDQAETRYQITIATAFREVRDALISYDAATERARVVGEQLAILREMVRVAGIRYDGGYIARIELIDAERMLLEAELLLVEAARDRLLATASLFKALGGGFDA